MEVRFYFVTAQLDIISQDLTSRRSHLTTHHSPEVHGRDCNSDMPADYYMSRDTYEAVMGVFNKYLKRPRDNEERTNQLEALFNEVWCIIFPKDKFPGLQKPRSPCMSSFLMPYLH